MDDLAWTCVIGACGVIGITGMAFAILNIWKTGRLNG